MPRIRIVPIIVLLNLLVFAAWSYAYSGNYLPFMIENFLVSWNLLSEGKFWDLLTSAFSHNAFFHLFINMYALLGFGSVIENQLGSGRFLRFYLLASIVASLMHALVSLHFLQDPSLPALGASGAICGLILLFSLLFPNQKLLIMGLIPIRAIWGALLLIGLDVWGLTAQSQGGGLPIGHGAHLGGSLVGIIYFFKVKRKEGGPWRSSF